MEILKRLLGYARIYHANLSDISFETLLYDWPALRQVTLLWWQAHSGEPAKLSTIATFISSAVIVDHAALLAVATSLVNANLKANLITQLSLESICSSVDTNQSWGLYAVLWIYSKYGTDEQIMKLIEKSVRIWVTEESLSRLVAGLYPRLMNTPHFMSFQATVKRLGARWSLDVFNFHERLATTVAGYTAVQNFVKAPNTSLPNQISHPKFLMLMSLLNNPLIQPGVASTLEGTHSYALGDPFYKILI